MKRLALAACLVLMGIATAPAQEPAPAPVSNAWRLDQTIYKGLAGNLLDTMPLEPEARVSLQRANAVISNPLSWRSAGLLLGVANPVFLIGGLVWGIWSAANIEAPKPDTSWLGAYPGERISFCGRPRLEACRLQLPHESDVEQPPRIEHAAVAVTH